MAPEVLNLKYGNKCDLWAAGVILYIMLNGNMPFHGETEEEIEESIKTAHYKKSTKEFVNLSDEVILIDLG
jgi:calcium-dependent protein kinase